MEQNPQIGYCFCPVAGVRNGRETGVLGFSIYGGPDRVVRGHKFLKHILNGNVVASPAAMARRECYESISAFPLDIKWADKRIEMVWCGDWYLWCVFALQFDVAYFSDSMVCYREHELGMTSVLTQRDCIDACAASDMALPWLIRQKAEEKGLVRVSNYCLHAIAREYARQGAGKQYRSSVSRISVAQFEQSLCESTKSEAERRWIRARFFTGVGDGDMLRGDAKSAKKAYLAALRNDVFSAELRAKLLLLPFGKVGRRLRGVARRLRALRPRVDFTSLGCGI
jgi:hypothetical protein